MVERARPPVRLFYPLLLDGDDHERNFQLARATRHNIAIIDGWSGGQLEVLGVAYMAGRIEQAAIDRLLLDKRPTQGYWVHSLALIDGSEGKVHLVGHSFAGV